MRRGGETGCVVVLALALLGPARAQEAGEDAIGLGFELDELETSAAGKVLAKDWPGAIEGYRKVIERVERSKLQEGAKRGRLARARYNIACAHALAGQKGEALDELRRAVELGFWSWDHIAKDGDLDSIRGEPAFAEAIEKGKAAERAAVEAEVAAALAGLKGTEPLLPGYDFDIVTTEGKPLRLADLAGKVVIVTWFWPAPGDAQAVLFPEVRELVKLRSATDPAQLAIVGICMAVNYDHDGSALKEFLEVRKINFPVGKVPADKIVQGAELVFIDRQGKVRANLRKPRREVIEAVTKELLSASAPGQ